MSGDVDGGGRSWWMRLRVILYFILGLAVVDLLVGSHADLWREYDPHPYRERLENCRRQPSDLVIVGGSPALYGIDPARLAGLMWQGKSLDRVYNLALPLATTAEVWHSVEHGLTAPPRLLIYAITITDLNEDRVEPSGPRYLMDSRDVAHWIRGRPESGPWCVRQFVLGRCSRMWQLFYYRNGIRLWAADMVDKFWPGAFPQAVAEARKGLHQSQAWQRGNGFSAPSISPDTRLDLRKAAGTMETSFPFMDHYRIAGYRAYLDRLLRWAERQRVPILLVDMPVPAGLEQCLYPREFASYRDFLREVESSYQVTVLHDTRQAACLTDADFCDLVHLNADGNARFSTWLRQAVQERSDYLAKR